MNEIQRVTLEQARNAAHYELVHQILEFAKACAAVTEEMTATLQPLEEAVEHEGHVLGISLRSELTERLDLTDRERDGLVTGIKAVANALTKNPAAEVSEAARQLMNELISLKVETDANYLLQTGQIDILLDTLLSGYTAQIGTCGLTQVVGFLQSANNRMHELLNQRDLEQAGRTGTAMTDARAATDVAYRAFIRFYNAWILVNAAALEQDDRGTTLFSTEANAKIDYFKRHVLNQPAGSTPGEEGEEEEETAPGESTPTAYTLNFEHNGSTVSTQQLEAGAPITAPAAPSGFHWVDVPATMPAHDLTIHSEEDTSFQPPQFG